MKKIALYGGAFDPVTTGHVEKVAVLLASPEVDEVWVIPSENHPFGKKMAPYEGRIYLLAIALHNLGPRVKILRRSEVKSFDLVQALRQEYPDHSWRLAIGADILQETHLWYRWAELSVLAPPLVLRRKGYTGGEVGPEDGGLQVSSTEVRAGFKAGLDVSHLVPAGTMAPMALLYL